MCMKILIVMFLINYVVRLIYHYHNIQCVIVCQSLLHNVYCVFTKFGVKYNTNTRI